VGFELTALLLGSGQHNKVNVIPLVCQRPGWEWRAHWAMEPLPPNRDRLACRHLWHRTGHKLGAWSQARSDMALQGEGLVGQVWASGCAQWMHSVARNPRLMHRKSANNNALWCGYVFPASPASQDGAQPWILAFYSGIARQQEAQLPLLAATMGALIAQTAQRLGRQAAMHPLVCMDKPSGLSNRSHLQAGLTERCINAAKHQGKFGLIAGSGLLN
jgi:hypothetical protein